MKRWIAKDFEIANREEFNTEVSLTFGRDVTHLSANNCLILEFYFDMFRTH